MVKKPKKKNISIGNQTYKTKTKQTENNNKRQKKEKKRKNKNEIKRYKQTNKQKCAERLLKKYLLPSLDLLHCSPTITVSL